MAQKALGRAMHFHLAIEGGKPDIDGRPVRVILEEAMVQLHGMQRFSVLQIAPRLIQHLSDVIGTHA